MVTWLSELFACAIQPGSLRWGIAYDSDGYIKWCSLFLSFHDLHAPVSRFELSLGHHKLMCILHSFSEEDKTDNGYCWMHEQDLKIRPRCWNNGWQTSVNSGKGELLDAAPAMSWYRHTFTFLMTWIGGVVNLCSEWFLKGKIQHIFCLKTSVEVRVTRLRNKTCLEGFCSTCGKQWLFLIIFC